MTRTVAEKRSAFRALHAQGCFVLPNPWDVGSARMLEHLGFQALASTSSGFAWTHGRPDYSVARARRARASRRTVPPPSTCPINADFESGFADGCRGCGGERAIGDRGGRRRAFDRGPRPRSVGRLYDLPVALERLRAARRAIDASGVDTILVARTELLLDDPTQVATAIDKLVAFAAAGADCLYAPGVRKPEDIRAMARAVAPKPLNVLDLRSRHDARRIRRSRRPPRQRRRRARPRRLGRPLAAAEQMKSGSFEGLGSGTSGTLLNEIFSK